MSAELFDPITCGNPRGPTLLHSHRVELQRELSEAVKACDEIPECYLDADRAKDAFRELATDGDDSWTRDEIREAVETLPGYGKHLDRLFDHVNSMAWAFWRLHRAERRAYGKEGK